MLTQLSDIFEVLPRRCCRDAGLWKGPSSGFATTEDEQGLREAVRDRRSVHLRCDDAPDGEAVSLCVGVSRQSLEGLFSEIQEPEGNSGILCLLRIPDMFSLSRKGAVSKGIRPIVERGASHGS